MALEYSVGYLSSFDNNLILIHVDLNSDIEVFQSLRSENVIIIKDRVHVCWGGYGMVDATIRLIRYALCTNFDYLFLLSGDDLPCKTNKYVDDFLKSIKMKNLIHFQDSRNTYVSPDERVKYLYFKFHFKKEKSLLDKVRILGYRIVKNYHRNSLYDEFIMKGGSFYKGTQWFSINKKTADKLMFFITNNDWYVNLFLKSLIPDELFFHTAIKYLGIDDNYHDESKRSDALRYIDWESGPDYPKILGDSDLMSIKRSECLFARKFSSDVTKEFFQTLLK